MPRPLSNDLRKGLVRAVESGMSARAAGRKLDIAASTATGIIKDWRAIPAAMNRVRYVDMVAFRWKSKRRLATDKEYMDELAQIEKEAIALEKGDDNKSKKKKKN